MDAATVELRVKIPIPEAALRAGHAAVSALAAAGIRDFERLLAHPELLRYGA